jgi:hypothetical protein
LVTKPTFLVLLPALVGGVILLRGRVAIPHDPASLLLATTGFAFPVLVWLKTQFFHDDSPQDILSHYANPYQLADVGAVIFPNFLRFFTESTPLHLLLLFAVWSAAFLTRLWMDVRAHARPGTISFAEAIAFVFCGLILLAYLRTPGWYRYFFPAQILSLVFLPSSLEFLWKKMTRVSPRIPLALVSLLILFQAYQTAFNSWVASTYRSTMTRELQAYFKTLDPSKSVYVVPEIIVFLPHDNYYHYIYVVGFTFGEREALGALKQGIPDIVVAHRPVWEAEAETFVHYRETTRIGRYVIAERQ